MKHLKNLCILAWCGIVSAWMRPFVPAPDCLCDLIDLPDKIGKRMDELSVWVLGACALTALYFFWSGVRVRGLCDRWGRWLCGIFWGPGVVACFMWFRGTRLVGGWELEAVVVLAFAVMGGWGLGCAAFAPDRWRRLGRLAFGLGILFVALLGGDLRVAVGVGMPVPEMFVALMGASALLFGRWPQGRVCRFFRWGCAAGCVWFVSLLIIGLCRVDSGDWFFGACLWYWDGWAVLELSLLCLGIHFLAGLNPAKWREKAVTLVVRTFRGLIPRGRKRPLRERFPWRRTP